MPATSIGYAKYNLPTLQNFGSDVSGAANGAVTSANTSSKATSVENPALWLVGIGALTLGLVAFSTHVRVGKFDASVNV